MPQFLDATYADIPLIQNIARETWVATYTGLLPQDQMDFMLEAIYSHDAIHKVMTEKSQDFILMEERSVIGFAAYGLRPEDPVVCKLHKLYLLPNTHGKGFGKMLLEEVRRRISLLGIHTLDLNVYRLNPALHFYEKLGFTILRNENIPFGPYTLNDYVMRLEF